MSNRETLKADLKRMIVERCFLDLDPEDLEDDAPLMSTYGIDSVALFEIVVGLEEEYGVTVEEEEFSLDLFATVNAIADLVECKRAE
ncbi:MAG TPA: acyl carrier protein [Armatimonadetes bacterium]|nr:acyl carrier protein [Armatimonadota bacterium]